MGFNACFCTKTSSDYKNKLINPIKVFHNIELTQIQFFPIIYNKFCKDWKRQEPVRV